MSILHHLKLKQAASGDTAISLFVPDAAWIQHTYYKLSESNEDVIFPYWARLWPAAYALADFLQQNPSYIKGKKVLELAAGLGLPSLVAARYALEVYASDYAPEAVAVMEQSVSHLGLLNVQCGVLNWNHLPDNLLPDVLLLSDINYDPSAFESLFVVLKQFIEKGTQVLLSTPQRLMAKPFIERLLPWCVYQEENFVEEEGHQTSVSILVLKKSS